MSSSLAVMAVIYIYITAVIKALMGFKNRIENRNDLYIRSLTCIR